MKSLTSILLPPMTSLGALLTSYRPFLIEDVITKALFISATTINNFYVIMS